MLSYLLQYKKISFVLIIVNQIDQIGLNSKRFDFGISK